MTKLIGGLDTETTGFDQATGDRLCEVALLTYDADTEKLVDEYVVKINPGRPVPADATRVHGYTYAMLASEPAFEDVAVEVYTRLARLDKIIIHNADFDTKFLGGELARVGMAFPALTTNAYCTMKNARWATFDGKSATLEELAFSLSIDFDPALAHKGEYDVRKMMECYFEGRRRGYYS